MDMQLDVERRTSTATKVVALIGIGALGGLFFTAHFAGLVLNERRDGRGGGGGGPVPYTPNDLTHVGTNVRLRPFGVTDGPVEGNKSQLTFSRSFASQDIVLGTMKDDSFVGSRGHAFTDGEAVRSGAVAPLAVAVGAGGGVLHPQHLTVFADGGVTTLCLPPTTAGTTLYFDTRGNPYRDTALQERVITFDCFSRTGSSYHPNQEDLVDGDAIASPPAVYGTDLEDGHFNEFISTSRADVWSEWGDLACMGLDLSFMSGDICEEHLYPAGDVGGSPLFLRYTGVSLSGPVTTKPNILMWWDDVGFQYLCLPELTIEGVEFFYVRGDGTLFTDPFLEDQVLPVTCPQALAQSFRPSDILDVSISATVPTGGSIVFTRGRLFSGEEAPPFFGLINESGAWQDKGLGGAGGVPVVGEEAPLTVVLNNDSDSLITFSQSLLNITTDTGLVSICIPETTVDPASTGFGHGVEHFFVANNLKAFRDPFFLDPAACAGGTRGHPEEVAPSG